MEDIISIEDAINRSRWKTFILFILMFAIAAAFGWAIGYLTADMTWGITFFVGFLVYQLVFIVFARPITLAAVGARVLDPSESLKAQMVHNIVEELSIASGLPKPQVGIIESDVPNAFATGLRPESGIVVVTRGLLDIMDREELTGVLAHEMSHIRHRDIVIGTLAAVLAMSLMLATRLLMRLAFWGVVGRGGRDRENRNPLGMILAILIVIIAPIAAMIVRFAISREREYMADAGAAMITRNPEGLASALEKLKLYNENSYRRLKVPEEFSHMFIFDPLFGVSSSLSSLFSTHPPIEERITRLRSMTAL